MRVRKYKYSAMFQLLSNFLDIFTFTVMHSTNLSLFLQYYTKGQIVYFIDGRSPSGRDILHLAECTIQEHFFEGSAIVS